MRKRKRKRTARIYYGQNLDSKERLFWTVPFTEAKETVEIDGSVLDAIRGVRGTTIGCHLSNCAKRNSKQFPHPFVMAAFTKSTAFIITKIKKGKPTHAVKYDHSYGDLVELNDKEITKSFVATHPELTDRKFRLRPCRPFRGEQRHHGNTGATNHEKRAIVPRGALKRAVDAGLVTPGLMVAGFE